MKSKLSITLDEETILEIQKQLHSGRFRHAKIPPFLKRRIKKVGFSGVKNHLMLIWLFNRATDFSLWFLTNKSHLIEYAVKKLLEVENGG